MKKQKFGLIFLIISSLFCLRFGDASSKSNSSSDTLCVRPYIVKVEPYEQDQLLLNEEKNCLIEIASKPTDSGVLKCASFWDTAICWPEIEVNQNATVPCPSYINKFNTKNNVVKLCLFNVTSGAAFWDKADYNPCLQYDKKDYCNTTTCSLGDHMKYIVIIRVCGYMASIVSLSLSILILLRPKMRCPRNQVHVNLFCAFVARTVLVMLVDTVNKALQEHTNANSGSSTAAKTPQTIKYLTICRSIVTIFRYTGSVYHMAIFSEAIYLVLLLKFPYYNESKGANFCIIISWLLPFLWMTPWIFTRAFVDNNYCWQAESDVNFILKIPHSIILVSNICCAVFIIRILYSKMRVRQLSREKVIKYRRLAKSILILIPIFGLHFIMFAWVPYVSTLKLEMTQCFETFITYVETFFNAFQGLVVSITCCFMHREAQLEFSVLTLQLLKKLKCLNTRTYMSCYDSEFMRKLRYLNSDMRSPSLANTNMINHNNTTEPLFTSNELKAAKEAKKPGQKKQEVSVKKLRSQSMSSVLPSRGINNGVGNRRCCFCCCVCLFGDQKNDFFIESTRANSRAMSNHKRNSMLANLNSKHSSSAAILHATNSDDLSKLTHLQLTRKRDKSFVEHVVIERDRTSSLKISLPDETGELLVYTKKSKLLSTDSGNADTQSR